MLNGREKENKYEDFRARYFNIFNWRFMVSIFAD